MGEDENDMDSDLSRMCPYQNSRKPRCSPETDKYRTRDGSCNNKVPISQGRIHSIFELKKRRKNVPIFQSLYLNIQANPLYGMSSTPFKRMVESEYHPTNNQPRGAKNGGELPSPRFISQE